MQKVLVESLRVSGYVVNDSRLTVEPCGSAWIVRIVIEVER